MSQPKPASGQQRKNRKKKSRTEARGRSQAPSASSIGRKRGLEPHILIHGFHAVREALGNPARKHLSLMATKNSVQRLQAEIRRSGVSLSIVEPASIDHRLPDGSVHQGLLLETEPIPPLALEDIPESGPIVLLDQVTDPQNVGAIMRTACAFGASALVMTERHAPRPSGALAKAASGTLEHLPYVQVTNLARAIDTLNGRGYQTIGLTGDTDRVLDEVVDTGPSRRPTALILGAEGKGIRDLTAKTCTDLAKLRLSGPITTLNVSAATAVALQIVATASATS